MPVYLKNVNPTILGNVDTTVEIVNSLTVGGNVGIGTAAPSSDAIVRFLHINDASSTSAGIVLQGARKFSVYSSSSSSLVIRDEQAAATRFVMDSSGNVGIGTTSPGVKFHISGGASTRTQMTISDNNTASVMLVGGASLPGTLASDTTLRFRTGANYLAADTGGVTAMTIDTSGNVVIGTGAARGRLDLGAEGSALVIGGTNGGGHLMFGAGTDTNSIQYSSSEFGFRTNQGFGHRFYVNGEKRLEIGGSSNSSNDKKVTIYGRLQLTNGSSTGIWFNVGENENQAFIGRSAFSGSELGLYYNGWKIKVNDSFAVFSAEIVMDYKLIHLMPDRNITTDYSGGIGWHSDFGNYGIYREGGGWVHPYPDLMIAFHTGIKIGAYFGYGGTRFYNNSNMATEIFSVGNGDNLVRVAQGLIVTSGNVGIGTTSPQAALDMGSGGIRLGGVTLTNWPTGGGSGGSQWTTIDSNIYYISGKVGIGTTGPASPLHVSGTTNDGTTLTTFTQFGTGRAFCTIRNVPGATRALVNILQAHASGGAVAALDVQQSTTASQAIKVTSDGDAATFSVTGAGTGYFAGNVGIGTTAPEYGLHLGSNLVPKSLAFTIDNSTQAGIVWKYIGQTKINAQISSVGNESYANKGLAFYTTDTLDTTTNAVERMRISESGKVGIGTASPASRLHVYGTTDATQRVTVDGTGNISSYKLNYNGSEVFFVQNYQGSEVNIGTAGSAFLNFYTSNTERARITAAGNVGIGTTSPSAKLMVVTTTTATGVYGYAQRTSGTNYGLVGNADGSGATENVGLYAAATSGTTNRGVYIEASNPNVGANNWALYSASQAQSYFAGNVGIGTTSPSQKLTVGTDNLGAQNQIRVASYHNLGGLYLGQGPNTSEMAISFNTFGRTGNGDYSVLDNTSCAAWSIVMKDQAYGTTGFSIRSAPATAGTPVFTDRFNITNAGNVGIGTASPEVKLHVAGSILSTTGLNISGNGGFYNAANKFGIDVNGAVSRFYASGPDGTTAGSYEFHVIASDGTPDTIAMAISNAGNVGIGTTTPLEVLHVKKSGIATGDNQLSKLHQDAYSGGGTYIGFAQTASANAFSKALIGYQSTGGSYGANGDLIFAIDPDATDSVVTASDAKMVIRGSGNVGIGTVTPTQKLEVAGTVKVTTLMFSDATTMTTRAETVKLMDVLLCAGGGDNGGNGAGGGGGCLTFDIAYVTSAVTVGAAGSGGNGGNSTGFTYTALGGGRGNPNNAGQNGGSGGGGNAPGSGVGGQGGHGGQSGGGGGAGGHANGAYPGFGRIWLDKKEYGCGGVGNISQVQDGLSVFGRGSSWPYLNRGGAQNGVVIIRYYGAQTATGGTITSVDGFTYHTFTSSGTFTAS